MAAAASGHSQALWARAGNEGASWVPLGRSLPFLACGEPPASTRVHQMAGAFWARLHRTDLAGWADQTSPGLFVVPKYNLNVSPVSLARDPPTHDFRGYRPENAGAQRRRRYLATASRRWHCVSNRPSRTRSIDHGDCRSGGARMAAARQRCGKHLAVGKLRLSLP